MAELVAKTPCDGLLPLEIGAVSVTELTPKHITSIMPRMGQEEALSSALKAAHGMAFPEPNRATGRVAARAVWSGRGQAMLIGPEPDVSLSAHASLTDQSDGWAVVRVEGDGAEAVLARLVPVDVRVVAFKRGHTARTELRHMMASITRVGDTAFQIMVFRSMAVTLVHDLKTAMEGVAARG